MVVKVFTNSRLEMFCCIAKYRCGTRKRKGKVFSHVADDDLLLWRSVEQASGYHGPLNRRSFYGSKAAGDKPNAMHCHQPKSMEPSFSVPSPSGC